MHNFQTRKYLPFLLFFTALFVACKSENKDKKLGNVEVGNSWYRNPFIYNVDIDAFKDSDGDGTGDFKGLTKELDYIKGLGVDVIWLSPFQPTPDQDDGYDVSDYYAIDPRLGNEADFTAFMQATKERKIKVIMDVVLNHTSIEHKWYQQARSDTNSTKNSWYVWSKKQPKDFDKGMVFPGHQTETWTWDDVAKHYYFHRFYDFQPDLNFQNKAVQQEAVKILKYWLTKGISGFRLDAVPFIIDIPETGSADPEHMFDILTMLRDSVKKIDPSVVLLGEANVTAEENQDYFGKNGERLQMMFNFYANQYLFYGLAIEDPKPFAKALEDFRKKPNSAQWAFFLRNHDEIDLGRLSKSERKKVFDAYGPEANMQLYDRGIRRRLAPMLSKPALIEMSYSLLFSLPGAPVIRYGEEIGMGDDLTLNERLSVRTPMQWNKGLNAGFSTAAKPFRPIINLGKYSYTKTNVDSQQRNAKSLLNVIKDLAELRKAHPEIGLGTWETIKNDAKVFIVKYAYKGETLIAAHNFSPSSQQLTLSTLIGPDQSMEPLIPAGKQLKHVGKYLIKGYGYQWFKVTSI
jgi:maltose alpha-D-glucosyltransferase/alpha-amylase